MGQEQEIKRRVRKEKVQRAILGTIAAAGVMSVALLAPNAMQMMKLFGFKPHRRQRESISRSRTRMIERGYLVKDKNGFLRLTSRGQTRLRELERFEHSLPRASKWDNKWRVLIFDIPEKRKPLREKVRTTLVSLGFKRLQDSVWVYPDDCEDLITLLKADFRVGKDLLYLIVDTIENDRVLREYFGITSRK